MHPNDLQMVERYIEVGGVRLHAMERGEGPLVILLPGFPDFWYGWRHQIGPLAEAGFRVVALDMRGYNLSDKPSGVSAYRLDRLADDVAQVIEALGERTAAVVGHDWGGIVAWHTALRHPARVRRLVILNAPPPLPLLARPIPPTQLAKSWYVAAFQVPVIPEMTMSAGDYRWLRDLMKREGAITELDEPHYVAAWSQPGALEAEVNYYRALARYGPWDTAWTLSRTSTYTGPVLILWGERDLALESDLAEPDPRRVPNARVIRFPGVSHWVQVEAANQVNKHLKDFLSEP